MRVLPLLLTLSACAGVDPAPEDVDGLLHFLWDGWADADDAAMHEAIVNLDGALPIDDLPTRGGQTRLTADQLASLGLEGNDPSLANGFFVVTELACTVDEVEQIFIALDQPTQYPDAYDDYERVYTSDDAAYRARSTTTLTWDVEIAASPVGFDYIERISGAIRRIGDGEDGTTELPRGEWFAARTWLTEPAEEDDDNRSFEQDYQLDVYYETTPGRTVHVYGIWRQIDLGALGDQDSDAVVSITLNNSESWDRRTEELCAALRE